MDNIYIEDYNFVVNTIISTHPLGSLGFDCDFESRCIQYRKLVKDRNSLICALSKLTSSLHDGHTNIEIPYDEEGECLNIPCDWFEDKLLVAQNYKNMKRGEIITSINNIPISDYFTELCNYIPHENKYLVKCRSTKFPYQNYHLFSRLNLKNILYNNDSNFEIKTMYNGIMTNHCLKLEKYNGGADFIDTSNFIDIHVFNNIVILRISECIFNSIYKEKLDEFFKMVNSRGINHIILDLSENMGGNSMVTQEFIKHLDIDKYLFYGISIREIDGNLSNIQAKREWINNDRCSENLYKGKIYCIISNTTYSSARIFATVLKDNNIAVLLGENSGGKPTSFGAPSKYNTPNTNIRFRVSARAFYRPDYSKDDEISLTPDIFIPQNIRDVDYIARLKNIIQYINIST